MNVLEQALNALQSTSYCVQKERHSVDGCYGSNFVQSRADRIEQVEILHKQTIAALKEAIANDTLKKQWQREALLEAKKLLLRSCPFGSNPQAWYVNEIEQMAKELE